MDNKQMMKAVICTRYGAPEVLQVQEVERPQPAVGEILIRIEAAAVTTAGLINRKGQPYFTRIFNGLRRPKKNILGMEFSGEVVAVDREVMEFQIGDQLFGLTGLRLGANGQFICLPQQAAITKKARNQNFAAAAAIIEGGLTALNFLKHKAKIQPGQKVLIYGASGSVGTASVQLAKYFGAHVTGVCSTANLEMVESLGADQVIDYTCQDFTRNGSSYDIIFDTVGKRSFPQCRNSLTPNGTYLAAAGLSTIFYMLWTAVFSRKKAILSTTYLRSTSILREDIKFLKDLIKAGAIKAVIDRSYPMEQAAQAHRYVETGRKRGNVILVLHNK